MKFKLSGGDKHIEVGSLKIPIQRAREAAKIMHPQVVLAHIVRSERTSSGLKAHVDWAGVLSNPLIQISLSNRFKTQSREQTK